MSDEIVTATPDAIIRVIGEMADLTRPEGDEWVDWEIRGLEGVSNWVCHLLPLAATRDEKAVAETLRRLRARLDRQWRLRHQFDATQFTSDQKQDKRLYDGRHVPASMIRSLGAKEATWWANGPHAVVLFGGLDPTDQLHKAAVMVIAKEWLVSRRDTGEKSTPAVDRPADDGSVLGGFLSGDSSRILTSVWAVIHTRDPEVLAPLAERRLKIERAADDVELGGALASNSNHFDHAMRRLELFERKTCLCAAYSEHLFYEPKKEESRGHVRRLGTIPNDGQWWPDEVVECSDCGKLFQVERGEYHYPWWKWTVIAKIPENLAEGDA